MAEAKTILVVEDEALLSSLIKTRLEKEGYGVTQAFNGEEAGRAVRERIPDVIVLDLILPKMSGFEFLEFLKSDPEFMNVPVIVMSNLGQESDIDRAKQLGVAVYLVKAKSSIDNVVRIVQSLL